MDCRKHQSQFTAHLDGDLSPGERNSLRAHLKECLTCYRKWNAFRKTRDVLSNLPDLDPPEHLSALVKARLNGTHSRQRPWLFTDFRRWLPLGIGVAAALVISVALWGRMPSLISRQPFSTEAKKTEKAKDVLAGQEIARFIATKQGAGATSPVMVLKVKDFSRADRQLEAMLRLFSQQMPPEREAVRPVRSGSARFIDVQVPGQRFSHLISELHKIGNLDQSQLENFTVAAPLNEKDISVRIFLISNGGVQVEGGSGQRTKQVGR